jgi:integrase/recombinase XerD
MKKRIRITNVSSVGKYFPEVFTPEEASLIIEQANKTDPEGLRDRAILEVLYSSGLRISELLNLRVSEIISSEPDLWLLRFFDKGNKERIIPIGSYPQKAIEKYLIKGRSILKKGKDTGFLFLNNNGEKLSSMGVSKIVSKYLSLAGIKKRVVPNIFRHSFATTLLDNDIDLKSIQEFLGHASIATTAKYLYPFRPNSERLKETVKYSRSLA